MKTILFLTKDLLMQSSASAAAKSAGAKIKTCGTVARLLERLAEEQGVGAVFVDLQMPGLQLDELASAIETGHSYKTVAFAQHVEEELLADAKLNCIDAVLTRGQFSHQLPQLIEAL